MIAAAGLWGERSVEGDHDREPRSLTVNEGPRLPFDLMLDGAAGHRASAA